MNKSTLGDRVVGVRAEWGMGGCGGLESEKKLVGFDVIRNS